MSFQNLKMGPPKYFILKLRTFFPHFFTFYIYIENRICWLFNNDFLKTCEIINLNLKEKTRKINFINEAKERHRTIINPMCKLKL